MRWCFEAAFKFYTRTEENDGEEIGAHDHKMRLYAKHLLDYYEGLASEFLAETVPRLRGVDLGDTSRRSHRAKRDEEIGEERIWFLTSSQWVQPLKQEVLKRLNGP